MQIILLSRVGLFCFNCQSILQLRAGIPPVTPVLVTLLSGLFFWTSCMTLILLGFRRFAAFETRIGANAMRHHNTLFHHLLKHIPRFRFQACVERHQGDKHVRQLDCWTQFVSLLYAQLSQSVSLRDVEGCMASHSNLNYHLGVKKVRRSTLADANAKRPAAIFQEVFNLLLDKVQNPQRREIGEVQEVLRLIDASAIPLTLDHEDWARFTSNRIEAKLHMVFDPNRGVPVDFHVTAPKVTDITQAKQLPIEKGANYVFDMGYYDFGWWARLHKSKCVFVTRLKKNTHGEVLETRQTTDENILSDRVIKLNKRMAKNRNNPIDFPLREIIVRRDDGGTLRLVSNDLDACAERISELYRLRWGIELFFKWIKQNLKIKKFLGTSKRAVKIQIIVAMIAYLLIKLTQNNLPTALSMTQFTRLIAANLMHRKTFQQILAPPKQPPTILTKSQSEMAL